MTTVGIIGAGGMGNTHARHLRRVPEVDLCVFDQDTLRAQEFGARHSCSCCASEEELFSKADLVHVCLPNDLHATVGLRALGAGKAVFMEKPLAGTLDDARSLRHAADQAGVPFMVGHVVRYFAEYRRAHQLVADGAIGTVGVARLRRGGGPPARQGTNWFLEHDRSGGILIDLAVHDFDWIRWTLGEVEWVDARSVGTRTGNGADYALTTLGLKSGALAHVETTWMDPGGFRTTLEVTGSTGMIEYDSRSATALRLSKQGGGASEGPLAPDDDPFFLQLRAWVESVRAGSMPPVGASEGFRSLAIAVAARESALTGRRVAPATE